MEKKHVTQSPLETHKIAKRFLQTINGGEVIGLKGELGAGKTTFVKGFAKALGIEEPVRSPSYTLMNTYATDFLGIDTLVHIDLYRLQEGSDLRDLALDEWLGDERVVLMVEWPERSELDLDYVIEMKYGDTKEERRITITG